MLAWLTIYDHTNYARWGLVYLADMKNLKYTAPEIYTEFLAGNFVVKRSEGRFNQVSPDHATEWMNKLCKMHNGIIGITRNDSARSKFCITWSVRSEISQNTKNMLGMIDNYEETDFISFTRNDAHYSQVTRDTDDVNQLVSCLRMCQVFRAENILMDTDIEEQNTHHLPLVSLATKDIATEEITQDLMSAYSRGRENVINNMKERLLKKSVPFHEPLSKNSSKTFLLIYIRQLYLKQEVFRQS